MFETVLDFIRFIVSYSLYYLLFLVNASDHIEENQYSYYNIAQK